MDSILMQLASACHPNRKWSISVSVTEYLLIIFLMHAFYVKCIHIVRLIYLIVHIISHKMLLWSFASLVV